jgi:hypothetical protein
MKAKERFLEKLINTINTQKIKIISYKLRFYILKFVDYRDYNINE